MDRPDAWLAPGRADVDLGGPPRSRAFGDIYFAPENGLAESEAVFLAGCGLPQAWAGRAQLTVAELGFGTGLNVLALHRLWRRERPASARLHVVSVEGYPLTREQAEAALEPFTEVADLARELLRVWPPRVKGVHRRHLGDGVTLTLAWLDVAEALAALDFAADAWFLDGFAPAKNQAMWSPEVLAGVAARSRPGARLASFSVAGPVRRGLEAVGFVVEKKPGFGAKRERLEASYRGPPPISPASLLFPRAPAPAGPILVVGAGIAGVATAQALIRRGVEVTVIDAAPGPAAGASGVSAGLVAPRLDLDDRPTARLLRTAYAAALDAYAGSPAFRPIGVLRLARDADEAARLARLLAAEALPPDMAIAHADDGAEALLFPQAGLLDPRAWIETALAGAGTRWNARAASLTRQSGSWVVRDADQRTLAEAAACILAVGPALASFDQTRRLSVTPSRGQVTIAPVSGSAPRRALLWGGYAAPLPDGRLLFGATHDAPGEDPLRPDPESDAQNLAALAAVAPALAAQLDRSRLESRVGVRAGTPDRLPQLGAVADADAYVPRFANLAAGRLDAGPPAPLHEGLYVIGGFGARGLVWAPALAEALASELLGEPGALEVEAAAALHPARGLARTLKRGEAGPT
jgi:tRNA 5-methylaminomethyl-2-thiouridine biosynthesis bifunctional protein